MKIICQTVRFFSIHPEYVAIILTFSTIAAIRVSIYPPMNILVRATPDSYQAT